MIETHVQEALRRTEERFAELAKLLEGSGLTVERKK